MVAKRAESNFLALWAILFPLFGLVSGYLAAVRGGHQNTVAMAFIGGVWGCFVALLFCMELAQLHPVRLKIFGVSAGVIASAISGYTLDWRGRSIAIVGMIASALALFAHRWVKHL